MTEDEAKTKWCPMVRYAVLDNDAFDNRAELSKPNRCIASSCMMWRTIEIKSEKSGDYVTVTVFPEGSGYCGLAGKP